VPERKLALPHQAERTFAAGAAETTPPRQSPIAMDATTNAARRLAVTRWLNRSVCDTFDPSHGAAEGRPKARAKLD